jgi:hypothetical protein
MFGSRRLSAALALAALAAGAAQAQIAMNPGAAGAMGFGGFSGGTAGVGLPIGGIGVATPYGLSTVGGNPYAAGSLGMSPYGVGGYGLSTAPGGGGMPFPYQYNPGYGIRQDPMNGYLTGVASVTSATGQYWKDIQSARLTREEARRSSFETTRKQIELQRWYEAQKPKTQDIIDSTVKSDLDRARKDAPMTEVIAGKSLNDLLNNVRKLGRLTRGPNIQLEEETLKHINLTSPAVSGNVGLLKDGGKITWPLSLQEKQFEVIRTRLSRNIEQAVDAIKTNDGKVEARLLLDIEADRKALAELVKNSQDDLTIGQYLEAQRFMGQLSAAVNALKDPQVKKYFSNTWNAKGKNVAELMEHMKTEGLNFGSAGPGDEAAYMALYYALREFESGLALAQK